MLERHSGQLKRSAVELAKDWRTDRVLRKLEAMLIVADADGENAQVIAESSQPLMSMDRTGCCVTAL